MSEVFITLKGTFKCSSTYLIVNLNMNDNLEDYFTNQFQFI